MQLLCIQVKITARLQPQCVSQAVHSAGLFAASLSLHIAAPAQRLAPEALAFAVRALRCAMPDPNPNAAPEPDPAGAPPAPKWLLPAGGWARADLGPQGGVSPLEVGTALGGTPDDAYFGSDGFRASALAAAMALPVRAAQVFGRAAALPELLAPAAKALRALGAAGLPQVGPGIELDVALHRKCREVDGSVSDASAGCLLAQGVVG